MFKVLLILFIAFYLMSKLGGFIIRTFFGSIVQKQQRQASQSQHYNYQKKPSDGNVDINFVPKNGKKPSSNSSGEYVDFEEVD